MKVRSESPEVVEEISELLAEGMGSFWKNVADRSERVPQGFGVLKEVGAQAFEDSVGEPDGLGVGEGAEDVGGSE